MSRLFPHLRAHRLALVTATMAFSAPSWADSTTVRPTATVLPAGTVERTLTNGLRVVILPLPGTGLVAVQTWMDVGARDEVEAGMTGFAHFFEHLMFHGTPNISAEEREHRLLELGVDENAWTSEDHTCYHLMARADRMQAVLEIEADRFQHLTLDDAGVRREAGAVYGEFRKGRASPDNRIWQALYATAFEAHTYHHPVIGIETDVAAMPDSLDRARTFFGQHYRPENATLVIAGDVVPAVALAAAEKTHGAWVGAALSPPPEPTPEPPQDAMRRAEISWTDGPANARLAMGWHIPAMTPGSDDAAVFQIVADLLGSPVAPLHRRLVEQDQLAWSVWMGAPENRDPGLLPLIIELREGVTHAAAETVVREELHALRSSDDLEARVMKARERARRAALLDLDAPDAWGFAVGSAASHGGDLSRLDAQVQALTRVDADAVRAALDRWLVDTGLTAVTLTIDVTE